MTETLNRPEIAISRLTEYSPDVAADLGLLLSQVWEGYSGEPMSKEDLEYIISSPDRDQIIATHLGRVVGMATVTLHVTPSGTEGWMNDFITSPDPSIRGHGVGRLVYDEVMKWCAERNINLGFTAQDPATHPIYESLGATADNVTTRFSADSSQ